MNTFIGSLESGVKNAQFRMEEVDQWSIWFINLVAQWGHKIPLGLLRLIAARVYDARRKAQYGVFDDPSSRDDVDLEDMLDRLGALEGDVDRYTWGGTTITKSAEERYSKDFEKYFRDPWW